MVPSEGLGVERGGPLNQSILGSSLEFHLYEPRLLSTAEEIVRHECAVLGATTYAANHHIVTENGDEGRLCTRTLRDSTGVRRPRICLSKRKVVGCGRVSAPGQSSMRQVPISTLHRSTFKREEVQRVQRVDSERMAIHFANLRATLRPSSAPPASERFAALRARVAARELEARSTAEALGS